MNSPVQGAVQGRRLEFLRELRKGPATPQELSTAIGVSRAYASAVLGQLFHAGHLERDQLPCVGRGRPGVIYTVRVPGGADARIQ